MLERTLFNVQWRPPNKWRQGGTAAGTANIRAVTDIATFDSAGHYTGHAKTLPYFTLGCTYSGSQDMVTVVLPLRVRVGNFKHGNQVACH